MPVAGRTVVQNTFPHFGFTHLSHALGQRQIGDLAVRRIHDERVARQVQAEHQSDRAREDLAGYVAAVGVGLLDHA